MSKMIDISSKISNQLPTIRVSDTHIYSVNNRKNAILLMQATVNKMSKEATKKAEEAEEKGEEYEGNIEIEIMDFALSKLLGEKAHNEIEDMDLPLPEYKLLYEAVMAAATGRELEDVEQFQ